MQLDLELYREKTEVEPGVEISYIDIAPEFPSQTMVLIHGFGGRARHWRYQIETFALNNRVIAIDMRGHGRSTRPLPGEYSMDRMVADIKAIADHLQLTDPFVLVGHSFGVAMATEMASRHPERVSHLVLIAGAGEYDINPVYKVVFRLPESILRLMQPTVKNFVDASLRSLKALFLQNMRIWRGWELFPKLQMPTMVILGNRDKVLPQEAFERVAELVPPDTSEVVNVGVSAHMVMLERRDAVNRAIERFIEQDTDVQTTARWRNRERVGGRGDLLQERPWLAHYESDVPPTIDVPRLPLTRLLDRAWRRFPRRPALIYMGRTLSYRNLSAQAARFANVLLGLGVVKGDRVMILLPNVPQLVIAYYGTLRIGGVVVMANPLATEEEVVRQAQSAGTEVLISLTKFEETAVSARAQSPIRHVIFANVKDYLPGYKKLLFTIQREQQEGHRLSNPLNSTDFHWRDILKKYDSVPPQIKVESGDTAVLQFTSGTTGEPKGIMLTHRNLVANTLQVRSWLTDMRDGEEVVLSVIPFSHVYGMTSVMNLAISVGASMVLLPTFEAENVLQAIRKYRPTLFPGVPSMYVAINNFPGVRKYNIQSIRACISGAAPLPIEVEEAFEKLTKGKLVEGYGLSEASPVTHSNPIYGRDKLGSIGLPLPSTEARIVDLKTGRPLPPGQIGELVIRGPQVMKGYWQDAAATAATIDPDGWLHTHDVARMDTDGYFQIISRRQDMWHAEDGETPFFPRDVEEVMYELPEVNEAVIVAVANRPIAFVSLKAKNRIPAKTIIAYCQRRLPPNQVPRLIIFVNEFPRSFIGKVLRRELLSRHEQEISAGAGSVGDYLSGLEQK